MLINHTDDDTDDQDYELTFVKEKNHAKESVKASLTATLRNSCTEPEILLDEAITRVLPPYKTQFD